ncbi:MAG: PhzF family phenazine biosynthesis protein [Myxococcota bacterium]
MKLPFLQIDAFAESPFTGNPAAVVRLPQWLDDRMLQAIASENNLSETAFLLAREPGVFDLRWFTPTTEVDLCGHATLASGHAVLTSEPGLDEVAFDTRSGRLTVRRTNDGCALTLPAIPAFEAEAPAAVVAALGRAPVQVMGIRDVHHAKYYLARFAMPSDVLALDPDVRALGVMKTNVVCTAEAGAHEDVDFVSRFFAPASGVGEDPVTGSAHCTLAPFWVERLGKNPVVGFQRSARGGRVHCTVEDDRVVLRGSCTTVITGTLHVDGEH